MASLEPFNRVVKLAARAFYDNLSVKGDNQPKNFRGDNRGMAVVVLDALTRREWVQEENLAKDLKLHSKQLRRIIHFFEQEKLIMREHRKESAKGAKAHTAVPAVSDGQPVTKEGEEKSKMHTYSYCCLDYAQICDVVRYRIHCMKKKLKDELDRRDTIQHYLCHSCNKRYSAFDALQLVSYTDEYFHCETCNSELVAESDKLVSEEIGSANDNARKCSNDELKDMQQRMDKQLKPLVAQLERVKKLPAPEFGSLRSWQRANGFANGGPGAAGSSWKGQNLRDPDVDVHLGGAAEDGKNDTPSKVVPMPPWMIGEGMNLTKQQRGERSSQSRLDESLETKDDNRSDSKDEMSIKDEYMKAYYKAWRKREEEVAKRRMQHEDETLVSDSQSERQVGEKYKREDQDEGIEWEEDQIAGNSAETYKLADLGAEDEDSGNDEDGIEWEEG